MLKLLVPSVELFDNVSGIFTDTPEFKATLFHSLISLSRWESIWQVPLLPNGRLDQPDMTHEELVSYIQCMSLQPMDEQTADTILKKCNKEVNDYIANPYSATRTYRPTDKNTKSPIVTSELIYFWMIQYKIPDRYERWHLNRLLTLIDVCDIQQNPEKMKQSDVLRRNQQLNMERKRELGIT